MTPSLLPSPEPALAAPALVLDTNVVMDWLVFRNPALAPLAEAVASGRVTWIATADMAGELAHVLGRGVAQAYAPDLAHIRAAWARWCTVLPAPLPTLVPRLRCTDPDDQKFIDLALHRARWLVTRDRAVLKLARRAAALEVVFTTPERWSPE